MFGKICVDLELEPPHSTLFCSVLRASRYLSPGAVLGGRQLSPGEVVVRMSPAVASRRHLRHFILTCHRYLSPGEELNFQIFLWGPIIYLGYWNMLIWYYRELPMHDISDSYVLRCFSLMMDFEYMFEFNMFEIVIGHECLIN
jgi:hypothetical protein